MRSSAQSPAQTAASSGSGDQNESLPVQDRGASPTLGEIIELCKRNHGGTEQLALPSPRPSQVSSYTTHVGFGGGDSRRFAAQLAS